MHHEKNFPPLFEKLSLFILVLLLIGVACLVYAPHFHYGFPLHADEWFHIAIAKGLRYVHFDYFLSPNFDPMYFLFHLSLYVLDHIVNLVKFYQFLAALNAILICSVLFFLMKKRWGVEAALAAVVFFATLRSNVNLLGPQFFLPMSVAMGILYFLLFKIEDLFHSSKKMIWFYFAAYLELGLIHASSFLFVSVVLTIYFLVVRPRRRLWILLGLFLIFGIVGYLMLNRGLVINRLTEISNPISVAKKITWPVTWIFESFNPFLYYGILPSFFALIGFIYCLRVRRNLPICIHLFLALFNWGIFSFIHLSIFSSFQRSFYQGLIAAVPLSAIGFCIALTWIRKLFENFRLSYSWKVFCLASIAIVLLAFSFQGYSEFPKRLLPYHLITEDDYDAMIFLRDATHPTPLLNWNRAKTGVLVDVHQAEVMVTSARGTVLYAIAQKLPIGGSYFYSMKGSDAAANFFLVLCPDKAKILKNFPSIRYVYSRAPLDCEFLRPMGFDRALVHLYQVK